ncbi:MAG: chorismate mutase [Bryobacteraceae bacterium]|jgi:chorismate mutase|nr:chorismate mutase [Bryobacteraceae bacterium]
MTPEEAQAGLDRLRAQVDEVDLRLLALFNERARIVEGIGAIKKEMSIPIYEPKREEMVFQNVLGHNGGPLSQGAIRRLFERIIDEMRTLQRERMAEKKEKQA